MCGKSYHINYSSIKAALLTITYVYYEEQHDTLNLAHARMNNSKLCVVIISRIAYICSR